MIGQRYGNLLVLEEVSRDSKGKRQVRCRCTCGTQVIARLANLVNGHTKSCGCLRSPRISMADRFWLHVERSASGCWRWTGCTNPEGYGRVAAGAVRVSPLPAHRVAYELLRGPIPSGLHLDHLCRNRWCVNPAHLEPVTCRTNVLRGEAPTAKLWRANRCLHGHEFTPENTYVWAKRPGARMCRACARDRRIARAEYARLVYEDAMAGHTEVRNG